MNKITQIHVTMNAVDGRRWYNVWVKREVWPPVPYQHHIGKVKRGTVSWASVQRAIKASEHLDEVDG